MDIVLAIAEYGRISTRATWRTFRRWLRSDDSRDLIRRRLDRVRRGEL